ncbi:MAG: HAMP domain-containing histidine kinase [bacterium]|nr:HAMP domain-containing histidine kinase [bacterium]
MATGARTVRWRILIWVLPLQVLVFAGFQIWLANQPVGPVETAGLSPAETPLTHEQMRTIRVGSGVLGGAVLLVTFLTVRLLLDRHLRRTTRRMLARAAAIRAGQPHRKNRRHRPRELKAIADELDRSAQRISQQKRELRESERLVVVGQMVAGLSHTLKNILNGLRAGQFVLDRALKTGNEDKLHKGLDVTRTSVARIERLIFDMLNYTKDREPKREAVDPNHVVAEVIEELQQLAGSWDIELRDETDPDVGPAALDHNEIFRALVDLTTNAIEACTEGGKGDLVALGTIGGEDEVVLLVEDNGIGMTDDVLDHLYTRFVSTKATGGTGLGMVVVKKIIDEHGGTIDVESAPGEGTTFRIRLPRAMENATDGLQEHKESAG